MKILLVGAGGTLGKAIAAELSPRHSIIAAGRSGSEVVDIADFASVEALFARVGKLDAIVCAAGNVHFGPLAEMTPKLFDVGLRDKLMGQVNLVIAGQDALNDSGSISLVSGILTHDPIRFGASASMANGAIESFVKAAAIELPRGLRINVISPNVLIESMDVYGAFFRGSKPVAAKDAALAFAKSVEGAQTGQVYQVF